MDELTRLLVASRGGNVAAFSLFVRATRPMVWRFCAHLAGHTDADDATQETYIAVWRALPNYKGEAAARTWLFVIARRTAERVAQRHRRWLELAVQVPSPSEASMPGAWTEIEEQLGELDFDRRTALVLTQILGFSYGEAAEICDCPIGTIRSRVARARGQLIGQYRQNDQRNVDVS